MFSTNPLIGFSSKFLCDFPIIYGLFFFHNWEGLTAPVNSNYVVCIFSKYSYSKCNVGLLTQNVMTSIRMYLYCSRTRRVSYVSAGGNIKACYTSHLLNAHKIPCAGGLMHKL